MRRFNLYIELTYILLFAAAVGWLYPQLQQRVETVTAYTETPANSPYVKSIESTLEGTPQERDRSVQSIDLGDLLTFPFDFPDFRDDPLPPPKLRPVPPAHVAGIIDSVYEQSRITRSYDPAYVRLSYPGGDVAPESGVCTDVIVRAFREQNVDLQRNVHEDMRRHFRKYPRKWGLRKPDRNIDHRRVPNMMTYFERKGYALPISDNSNDYLAGDVVAWRLNEKQFHVGIVMQARSPDKLRPMIGHNINAGTNIQDVLFNWDIVGHYRYFPKPTQQAEQNQSSPAS